MQRFPTSEPIRAILLGQRVHIDLGGPLPLSKAGERFYLLIVDDYTRYS